MNDTTSSLIYRDITTEDINGVIDVHRNCFPAELSIFSVLSYDVVRLYYSEFVEPENYGAVAEDTRNGRIAGFAIGTFKPDFHSRFAKKYLFVFCWNIFKGLFVSSTVRKVTFSLFVKAISKLFTKNVDPINTDNIPSANGPVGIFMPIAIHSDYRGGGNAVRLANYFTKRMFDKGMVRVRGRIAEDNIASLKLFRKLGWSEKRVSKHWYKVWIDLKDLEVQNSKQ